jgi:Zn-dependent peptidase ImmA (M78 family)
MTRASYRAEPLRRAQLRALALSIRTLTGLENELNFPIMKFLELVMPRLYPRFHYEIVPKDYFPPQKHAETDVVNHIIRIREDIYLGATNELGRDRMTVAHEAAHYMLCVVYGVKFDRVFGDTSVITYQDPEWQATALAGELLCPHHLIKGLSPEKIARVCGVSEQAALFAYKLWLQ